MMRALMGKKRKMVQVVETLKSSGAWTVPDGCKSVEVWMIGGGGAGGGGVSGSGPDGLGGGSGYIAQGTIAVTKGQVIPYTIGAGGAKTPPHNDAEGSPYPYTHDGGATSFSSLSAAGGKGGGNRGSTGKAGDGSSGGGGNNGLGGLNGTNGKGSYIGYGNGQSGICPFNGVQYGGGGSGYGKTSAVHKNAGAAGINGDCTDGTANCVQGKNAKANTGAGGGGGYSRGGYGGAGGSGIIVLRYLKYE